MSKRFPELDRARISLDEPTRQSHLDSISSAIRSVEAPRTRRLRLLAIAMALILLLPVIALASEGSVPGDFLYPIKRMVEPIASVFDGDVAVVHRVEEVETLHRRKAPADVISEHVDRARDAVTEDHTELSDRLDRVVVDLGIRDLSSEGEGDPAKDDDGRTDLDRSEDERSTGGDDSHDGESADSDDDDGRVGSSTTIVNESDDTLHRGDQGSDG